jgi:hypothetical protein
MLGTSRKVNIFEKSDAFSTVADPDLVLFDPRFWIRDKSFPGFPDPGSRKPDHGTPIQDPQPIFLRAK